MSEATDSSIEPPGQAPSTRRRRPALGLREASFADVVAGVSVGLGLIPQSLAYAELAGMPPIAGLYAGALPPIVASLFASSPYLQTGPVASVSLLTFTSLSGIAEPGSAQFASLALLLALVVGALWLLVGLLRASVVAYLLSQRISWGSSRRSHRDRGFAAADRRSGRTRRRDRSCRSSGGC